MNRVEIERVAEVYKALGDPTRLAIVDTLSTGRLCVTDLAKAAGMDAPKVSFHLTRLKFAGLVADKREGQRVYYALTPEGFVEAAGFLNNCALQTVPES